MISGAADAAGGSRVGSGRLASTSACSTTPGFRAAGAGGLASTSGWSNTADFSVAEGASVQRSSSFGLPAWPGYQHWRPSRSCRPSGAHRRARAAVRSPSVRRRVRARRGLQRPAPPRSRLSRRGRPHAAACVGDWPSHRTSFAFTPKRRGPAGWSARSSFSAKKGRKKGSRGNSLRTRCGYEGERFHRPVRPHSSGFGSA